MSSTVDSKTVCETFSKSVREKYDLGEDILGSIQEMMGAVLSKYYLYSEPQAAAKRAPSKKKAAAAAAAADASEVASTGSSKKTRKTSAYNVYVREQMQDESVKSVEQKEKMSLIGNKLKDPTDTEKAVYKAKAEALNASATPAAN